MIGYKVIEFIEISINKHVQLVDITLDNRISVSFLETVATENVIFCRPLEESLDNISLFVTKDNEFIHNFITESTGDYLVTDITLDDGTVYSDIKFKIVTIEEGKELPASTINIQELGKPSAYGVLPPAQLLEEEVLPINNEEDDDFSVIYNVPDVIDNSETIQKVKALETKLVNEHRKLEQEKNKLNKERIVLEADRKLQKTLEDYKSELLQETFLVTNHQKELIEKSISDLNESFQQQFDSQQINVEKYLDTLSLANLEEVKQYQNDQIGLIKESVASLLTQKLEASSEITDKLLVERAGELSALFTEKLVTELEEYKRDITKELNGINITLDSLINEKLEKNNEEVDKLLVNRSGILQDQFNESVTEQLDKHKTELFDEFKTVSTNTVTGLFESRTKELNTALELVIDEHRKNLNTTIDQKLNEVSSSVSRFTTDIEGKLPQLDETIKDINKRLQTLVIEKKNVQALADDARKYTDTKVAQASEEMMNYARRILDLGGGGGSVAVQFANGGTMNGSLNVTGQYLSGGVDISTLFGKGGGGSGGTYSPYTTGTNTGAIIPVSGSNTASGIFSNVAGGSNNLTSGNCSFVGGGDTNCTTNTHAVVAGGNHNCSIGGASFVGGGRLNTASAQYSAVVGGNQNGSTSYAASVVGGQNNNATGDYSSVVGGSNNIALGNRSNVTGGIYNTSSAYGTNVAGGGCNAATQIYSNVAGGYCNTASGSHSNVAGGGGNTASGNYSTIANGSNGDTQPNDTNSCNYIGYQGSDGNLYSDNTCSNYIGHYYSIAEGPLYCCTQTNYTLTQTGNLACGQNSFIGNGKGSCGTSSNYCAIINNNTASAYYQNYSTGSWGRVNTASGIHSTVINGCNNIASGNFSTIAGGFNNNDNGHSNVFILGSNLCATQSDTTYVNTINSRLYCGGTGYGSTNCNGTSYGGIGGTININGGNGADSDTGNGGPGGSIDLTGGNSSSGGCPAGSGGSIDMRGAGGYSVDPGGSLNTSCGGGSIITNGTGCIGLGYEGYGVVGNNFSSSQTMICGTATAHRDICFPDKSGVVALLSDTLSPYISGSGTASIVTVYGINTASGCYSTIGGGNCNAVSGRYSTIVNGFSSCATGYATFVGAGSGIKATGNYAVAVGGRCNTASGNYSSVLGGGNNIASGACSAILGGCRNNTSNVDNTFILGSDITASLPSYTYVNNLSSQGTIATSNLIISKTPSTFTNPVTASGTFLIVNINGTNKAIQLWDYSS